MSALINPALMKETTGSNQFGPLQIAAATYNYWRVQYIDVKLTPLVGASAVSGTVVRTSINLAAQPGSPSWSALGARKHKDTSPGKPVTFRIRGSDIMGPKEGWFCCNTKNDPQMCLGGSIEIHTFGKTMSTYKSDIFDGPLFLAEVTALWQFKNYNPQPGMLNLVKAETTEPEKSVKINATPGEPITISVPADSSFARVIGQADLGVDADATPSEIIWQVCDTAVEVVDGILPPPFQWLIKAGWWFLKRIANKKKSGTHVPGQADANEVTFQLYQSMSDAMNNVPCIATGSAASTNELKTGWNITQVTPGNVGQAQDTGPAARSIPLTLDPISISSTSLSGQSAFYGHYHDKDPHSCVAIKSSDGTKAVYTYSIWDLNRPDFIQNGQLINPTQLQSQPYVIYAKENADYVPIGRVYAAGYAQIGKGQRSHHWTTVCWKSDVSKRVNFIGTSSLSDQFVLIQPKLSQQPNSLPRTTYEVAVTKTYSFNGGYTDYKDIEKGNWYLSAFTAWQRAPEKPIEFEYHGVPFYLGKAVISPAPATEPCEPSVEAFDVGAAMQTTRPLSLKPPAPAATALTASEILQLRQLLAPRDDYPSSEYDNLEMPPLEGEEEEEQGATGYTPPEEARQQRVRPPEAILVFKDEDTQPLLEDSEEDDDEDYESDLDDDDYAEIPTFLKNILTPEAKSLCEDLRKKGLDHDIAVKAAQAAFPHPAPKLWEATYHNSLVDGCSPPTARDCAWRAVSEYL